MNIKTWKERSEGGGVTKYGAMLIEIDELRAKNNALEMEVSCLPEMRDEIAFLRAKLEAQEGQEPVGFVDSLGLYLFRTAPNNDMISFRTKPAKGDVGVYLAAGAKGEVK